MTNNQVNSTDICQFLSEAWEEIDHYYTRERIVSPTRRSDAVIETEGWYTGY